ncbi:MAG: peptidylprolyl isomerase, partial [Candidatus Polarisedimenticolia bacterium]
APTNPAPPTAAAPQRVAVQHILISVGGKLPGKPVRTADEARTLAGDLLERARGGQDYDALVRTFTDDRAPGIYRLANHGVTPSGREEYPRRGMVSCFGDVAFALAVGEIGLCEYDERASPWGFHIIKRIR